MDLRDVGNSTRHVFKPFFIRFVVGDKNNLGVRLRQFFYAFGKLKDGYLLVRTDIEDVTDGILVIHQVNQGPNNIADIPKTPTLFSIAINCDRPSRQSLLYKSRYHHSILTSLAGAYRVK